MSSNLENSSARDIYPHDYSHYLHNTSENVFDPALSQVQNQYHQQSASDPIGQGLAQSADHGHPQHPAALNGHWNGNASENGGNAYPLNQFGNTVYPNEPYSDVQARQPSTNYFNQPQFQTSPSQYQHHEPQYAWQSNGNSSAPTQHQSVAPRDLQNNQTQLYDNTNAPHQSSQATSQQLAGSQPNTYQPLPGAQGAVVNLPIHWPLPSGQPSGKFIVTSVEDLERSYNCEKLGNFVHIGREAKDTPITKLALPTYVRRKSRNEIAELLSKDSSLKSKHNKKIRTSTTSAKPDKSQKESHSPAADNRGGQPDSSDSESDASSSEEEQPPLPEKRPTSTSEATAYDTVKALWHAPYKSATRQQIKRGLEDFYGIISTIRRRWRSDAKAVEAALQQKDKDLPMLKERVLNQRHLLDVSLKAALKHGHRDIIEHFGRHLALMGAFSASLTELTKELDWKADLAKSILEVLSRCTSKIEGETVEKTNLLKLAVRFSKRGDDTVKSLAKIVIDNATAAVESLNKTESKPTAAAASPPSEAKKKGSTAVASPVAGSKRPREDDTRSSQASKKTTGGAAPVTGNAPPKKASAASENKTTPNPATVKKVPTKPTNFFASLQPAYKKSSTATTATTSTANPSGTTPVSRSAASAVEKKTSKAPTDSAPSAPAFSFAATMANLTKPKEVEPLPKKKENTPPETAEERSRRLRKEKRRNLRVTFKPDSDLVQIRVFEHHPDEEVTHNASEVRDVKDLEGEGRMFKLKQQAKQQQLKDDPNRMDLDDDDDDEEDENDSDVEVDREYILPSQIDFSSVPEDERDRNYSPYGGGRMAVESPEAEEQTKREADTLVVVYPRTSDIPLSPKEPPLESAESQTPKFFGAPPNGVLSKLSSRANTQHPPPAVPTLPPDLSAILSSLAQHTTVQTQQAQQQPAAPNPIDLSKIVAQLSKPQEQPQPSVPQPQPQSFQPQYPQWNPMASIYTQQSSTPPQPVTQPASLAQPPNLQDISALLASLQGQIPMPPPQPQPQAPSMNAAIGNPPEQQSQIYENEDRRRLREAAASDQGRMDVDQTKQQYQQQQWQPKKHPRQFVLPCKYWPEGKCAKGANCTYRHDMT